MSIIYKNVVGYTFFTKFKMLSLGQPNNIKRMRDDIRLLIVYYKLYNTIILL